MSKHKWILDSSISLYESQKMASDPENYLHTICGIHWAIYNELNDPRLVGKLPPKVLARLNERLSTAFLMGKRMDFRLRQYLRAVSNLNEQEVDEHTLTGKFVKEVPKKEWKK